MPRQFLAAAWVLLLCTCSLTGGGCGNTPSKNKTITLKVVLPQENATVFVDGTEVPGTGAGRIITRPMPEGKDHIDLTIVYSPNAYTKITRPRKVAWKEGSILVDLLDPSIMEKDQIEVRFVATPQELVKAMCKLANIGREDVVYDLGCGDGRMVITAVKEFGAKRGIGVELSPDLVAQSKEAAIANGIADKVEFREGDVLKVEDLSDANVVLLYMGEDINLRLKPVLQHTLKPGSRVVSHRFLMGSDWPPDRTEKHRIDKVEYFIHLWVLKDQKK